MYFKCPHLKFLIFVFTLFTGTGRAFSQDAELENFASMLIGEYSSKKQSESDTAYFNITLSMSRIWPERKDGIWLYVEQAMATKMDKPYRQRVYQLTHPSADVFSSEIFTIVNADEVIGAQKNGDKLKLLAYDRILLKDGCEVLLKRQGSVYTGGTVEDHCPSDLRGAKYATTKIVLKPGMLESWDQGFDQSGRQVWGATKGGYIFLKE